MIPLRLRLKNFLGYRNEQELSLEGIRLACLSGDNGAGKSSLLDAMTWALWGQARGKSSDDLVHLGQTDMEVELEFGVGLEISKDSPARYRVLRKQRRGAPGHPSQSILELNVASIPTSPYDWRTITGNGLRDTQHKIEEIVKLNYDTFINSAFLLQGRADEFTIKAPAKRKELLAEILGLSFYEELEKRARDKRRENETRVKLIDLEIENIIKELTLKPIYENELKQSREALEKLEPQLQVQEEIFSNLRQKKGGLEAKVIEHKGVSEELARVQTDIEHLETRHKEHERLIKGYDELLSKRPEIESYYTQLLATRKEAEIWNEKLLGLSDLQQQQNRLEHVIKDVRSQLDRDLAMLKNQVKELENKAQMLPQLRQSISQGQAWLVESNVRDDALRQKRKVIQDTRDTINSLKSVSAQLDTDIVALREKVGLLSKAVAHCPLCEAELGESGKQLLQSKYLADIQARTEARNNNLRSLEEYQKQCQAMQKEADDAEIKLKRERDAAHKRMAVLESQLEQATTAEANLVNEKDKLSTLEVRLTQGQFAQQEQSSLARIKEQITLLGYDKARHEEVVRRLKSLEPIEAKKRQLDDAEIRIQSERLALLDTMDNLNQGLSKQQALKEKIKALMTDLALIPDITNKLRETEDSYKKLQLEERGCRDKVAKTQGLLERCQLLEQTKSQKEVLRAEAAKQEGIYRELAEAFGKKGVPALLIDAALPELEMEANRLLSRMTDNRLNIKLETQRDPKAKKGEPIETLDIKISDELGTRDYEMFSGGEAFRINLAIRIALSKLLARRAGAPLPTLVIDEGFGTQDSNGREKLVEAINSIQEDFEKVLVITHIEELKDLFPVRIEVTKTNEGSTFKLIE